VRSPESIGLKNERLSAFKGNVTDESQLAEAMQNHDAVISTLGPREVFKPSSLLNDSSIATSRAMQRRGVKRLVVLSAAAHFPGILNRIASFILRNHMRDSLAMEKIVQANGLDWTIARPPRLTQEDSLHYRSREGAAPRMGFTLSRKAVAAFMLDASEQKVSQSAGECASWWRNSSPSSRSWSGISTIQYGRPTMPTRKIHVTTPRTLFAAMDITPVDFGCVSRSARGINAATIAATAVSPSNQ